MILGRFIDMVCVDRPLFYYINCTVRVWSQVKDVTIYINLDDKPGKFFTFSRLFKSYYLETNTCVKNLIII